jgi:uncharacterized protein
MRIVLLLVVLSAPLSAQVSIPTVGVPLTQDFDSLASAGTSSTLPTGWVFAETGTATNTTYTAGAGTASTGDTYSFGAAAATDRAYGGLQTGSLVPTIGVSYINNTGQNITSLNLSYFGEQWRLGTTARVDRLDFQYSLDATSLTTGTWIDVDALDFSTPNSTAAAGALDGNLAANRLALSNTINGLSIANGATFWLRWNDFNASGADDGLAIDQFSLTALGAGGGAAAITVADVSLAEGNAGNSVMNFSVNLNQPAGVGGVTATLALQDDTATIADTDYAALASTTLTIPAGDSSVIVPVNIVGDTRGECNERFKLVVSNPAGAVIIDGEAFGNILNDDVVEIYQIQGRGTSSCFAGAANTVTTNANIVTAKTTSGFVMQTPDARADADALTSNGIFVFTASAPTVNVGDQVNVTGNIVEFFASTQFTNTGLVVAATSTGQTLPTPIALNASVPSPVITASTCQANADKEVANFECLESMRVGVANGLVNSQSQSFTTDTTAEAVVTASGTRALRETGIPYPGLAGIAATIPMWDTNPEIFELDPDRLGLPNALLFGGDQFTATGVISYEFNDYELWPTELVVTPRALPRPAPTVGPNQLKIGSQNLLRFFDTTAANNSTTTCTGAVVSYASDATAIATPARYAQRIYRASQHIVQVMGAPDVVGFEEVENLGVLQDIATFINAYNSKYNYVAYLEEGSDVGGIDVGFLVNTARVSNVVVTQLAKNELFNTDVPPSCLHDRPPLKLTATTTVGAIGDFTVIVNHNRSLSGIGDCRITGSSSPGRLCQKRLEQAQSLATIVQAEQTTNPTKPLILVGDFNAFEVTDGHVDVIGQIIGNVVPTQNQLSAPTIVNPPLVDTASTLPINERYSFVNVRTSAAAGLIESTSNVLDHALLNTVAAGLLQTVAYTRGNSDAREDLTADPPVDELGKSFGFEDWALSAKTLGISDHDGEVLTLAR